MAHPNATVTALASRPLRLARSHQILRDAADELDRLTARQGREHLRALAVDLARDERRLDAECRERFGDDVARLHHVRARSTELGRLRRLPARRASRARLYREHV